MRFLAIAVAIVVGATCSNANDTSVSTAAGGIQPIREARISMEKERLTIRWDKVTVEYEFLNTTSQDITVEVAFPLAPASWEGQFSGDVPSPVYNFRLWVDGTERKYETESKALLKGIDKTALLKSLKIDIATFGHDEGEGSPDVRRLTPAQRAELAKAGLYKDRPFWLAQTTYHWRQVFPAQRIVRIRHEYIPAIGSVFVDALHLDDKRGFGGDASSKDFCIDPPLRRTLATAAKNGPKDDVIARGFWVDYILTTANSWKTPIKDFELVIEKPLHIDDDKRDRWFTSLCWDGDIQQASQTGFSAKKRNFVPKHELKILFLKVTE